MKIKSNKTSAVYDVLEVNDITIKVINNHVEPLIPFYVSKDDIGDDKTFSHLDSFNPKMKIECGCGEELEFRTEGSSCNVICMGCGIEYKVYLTYKPV